MRSSQGTTAFNQVCKTWLQNYVFSLFYFYYFLSRQGCCPCSYVSPSAIRKLDLRSSLSLKFCVLNCFYVFWKIDFNREQNSFKALDLETIFDFKKRKESLRRCWTFKRSLDFLMKWRSLWVGFILFLLINLQSLF